MIIYFADRQLNIIGQASTELPKGLIITDDLKTEDVETGVSIFECKIPFDKSNREKVSLCTEVGNYILRSHDNENELYTIIEAEIDTKKQTVYIYAEDDGMDLLNEVVGEYTADKAYPITHYINKYAADAGFQIGINEAVDLTRKLSWDGEATASERIASVATQFDGCEVSYSFDVDGLAVIAKYINIYKQRGKDIGITLRLNQDIDSIVTTKSIANLATALQCTGGTPESDEEDVPPITLKGYSYDDGDFYVDGIYLKSRKALAQWARYLWKTDEESLSGGHIVKQYSYDTTVQSTLCAHAITELKKIRDMEVNYEVDIKKLPDNVKIGDRVNIVDDAGELYLSTRILKLETSVADQECKATLGEYLIKTSGISQKVAELAAEFAKNAQSAARALELARSAQEQATSAKEEVDAAVKSVEEAQKAVEEVADVVETAKTSAENAQKAADNAQAVVDGIEDKVESLETTIATAQQAADNAQTAANTAQASADTAAQAAKAAQDDADSAVETANAAKTAASSAAANASTAITNANSAISAANAAQTTAAAAKADAEQAEKDIAALGEELETVQTTMTADYARKTDLTESTANLQSQISQNAAEISSTVSRMTTIDETANDAVMKAENAQSAAATAQAQANAATADAEAAQTAADEARAAAEAAQSEADTAKAAATTAQGVADKAEADLEAAKADLATVSSRVDATEEEIAAAQAAVETAQAAADKANADAEAAASKANNAQSTANQAITNANNAQTTANAAATAASNAQKAADEAKGDASAAQQTADEAAATAAAAQATANTAKTNASNAQAKADEAAAAAQAAQSAADDADAKAAQAASDLATAKQNLADVTSRVDATEEEVAAAQNAVNIAQAAADKAKQDAEAAQTTANTAKANAAAAQTAANNAKTAADNAQNAADEAQAAADKAQAAVDALEIRVTTAETSITQNAEQIELRAKKTEVTKSIADIKVGGRNLVPVSRIQPGRNVTSTESFELQAWAYNFISNEDLVDILDPATEYTISYNLELIERTDVPTPFDMMVGFLIYKESSTWINLATQMANDAEVGTTATVQITFTTPEEWNGETLLCYSRRWTTEGASPIGLDIFRVTDFKIEKGNKATDWTPAPEDIDEDTSAAQSTANNAVERISVAESVIQQIADSISMLVTDGNGASLMTQTADGWTFSTAALQSAVDNTAEKLGELTEEMGGVNAAVDALNGAVADLGTLAEYIKIGTYTYTDDEGVEQTEPSIDLGESDSDFKLKITNTVIMFTHGSDAPVYISAKDKSVHIGKAVIDNELHIGQFVWKQRANGNLGLIWKVGE